MQTSRRTLWPLLAFWSGSALSASADTVQVVLNGSFVEAVRVGNYTVPATDLGIGQSEGEVSFEEQGGLAIHAADNRNLNLYFARSAVHPEWLVQLDSWTNTNGALQDFFLFEVGGNDTIQIAPRFSNGTFGSDTTINDWTNTGYSVSTGANEGQAVHGLSFAHSALRDAAGNPLGNGVVLSGLRIRSAGIDGSALLYVLPKGIDDGDGSGSVRVLGERRMHHPLTVEYGGPFASTTDSSPDNPFLDRRLTVRFTAPSGKIYIVAGFFDGDGLGGDYGTIWRAHFTPSEAGMWRARATFRIGPQVAISMDPNAGERGLLDGVEVHFQVQAASVLAPGFWRMGMMSSLEGHYRRAADGTHYLKGGTNSPENFLAYRGFDGVADAGGSSFLHSYEPHIGDWEVGDPLFSSNVHDADSKGIIGALNYLAAEGVNSIFMLLLNLGGDGWDVHPFVGPDKTTFDKTHFDVGRLQQWNTVFTHAMRKGIGLHFGLAETEPQNETWLDEGGLGVERKLFLREMIARFAHHPVLKWTLCEENDYSIAALKDFSNWIAALDPYGHPVAVHNHPNDMSDYNQLAGAPELQATSLQYNPDLIGDQVESLRQLSATAGLPWLVEADENNPWDSGLMHNNAADLRKRVLYDVYFSGGGVEWYMGYHPLPLGGDLNLEDFRTRQDMWRAMRYARQFMEANLLYWRMLPADHLLSGESGAYGGGEVFMEPGRVYAVYLPDASPSGSLDLSATSGQFVLRWFDPRTGEFVGSALTITASASVALGNPPNSSNEDWVALLEREDLSQDFQADVTDISVTQGGVQNLFLSPGAAEAGRTYHVLGTMAGTEPGFTFGSAHVPLNPDRYLRKTFAQPNQGNLVATYGLLDNQGQAQAQIRIPAGAYGGFVGTTMHHAYVLTTPQADYASQALPLRLVP